MSFSIVHIRMSVRITKYVFVLFLYLFILLLVCLETPWHIRAGCPILYICPRLYKLPVNLIKIKINIFVVADKCPVFIFLHSSPSTYILHIYIRS